MATASGPGHQRGVRVHVDAASTWCATTSPTASPWPSTGPSRRSATRRSPTYKANRDGGARHPAPADGARAPGGRDAAASRSSRAPGFEADDIIATLATAGPRRRRRRHHRHRRPRRLPARRGPARQGALQPARRVRLRALRRGRHRGAHRRRARRSTSQYAALRGDPSDNLPGVPGRRREDGGQAHQHLRRPRRHLRPRRRADAEAAPEPRRARGAGPQQRRGDGAAARRRRSTSTPDDLLLGAVRPRGGAQAVRLPRVPHAATTGWPRRSATDARARRVRAVDVLEAEVDDARRPPPRPSRCSSALADGDGAARRGRRRGTGAEGRSPLDGLALVADAATGDVRRGSPATLLADAGGAPPRSAALVGAGGRPLAAHDAKPLDAGADRPSDVDVRTPRPRHGARRLPARPGRVAATCSRSCCVRYAAASSCPTATPPPEGQLDFERRRRRPARSTRPAARWPSTRLVAAAARRARRAGPARAARRHRGAARRRAGPHGGRRRRRRRRASCERLNDQLAAECDGAAPSEIWSDAGEEFNVNSTPQLREVLFDKLGLHAAEEDEDRLLHRRRVAREAARASTRSSSTCCATARSRSCARPTARACWPRSRADGRIHATFNQTVARTGRLSSDAPNLHNIPVRSELGRSFRKAFVPGRGLRAAGRRLQPDRAALHRPPRRGPGPHRGVRRPARTSTPPPRRGCSASSPTTVTIEQRSKAKMVSYGLAYGMEAYGLGAAAQHPDRRRRQAILDAYFEAFPAVKAYMDRTVAEARERGYTETLFGRRRQIPELARRNFRIRQAGERQAMNAGIQGLAADIFKVALVRLDRALEDERPGEPAHPAGARRGASSRCRRTSTTRRPSSPLDAMAGAVDLRVPLEVNLPSGRAGPTPRAEARRSSRSRSAPTRIRHATPRSSSSMLSHLVISLARPDVRKTSTTGHLAPNGSASRPRATRRRDRAGPLVRAAGRPPRRRPTCATRSPRAPSRRSTSSSTRSACEPGERVLDVGCGPGRHAHALGRAGHRGASASTSRSGSSTSPTDGARRRRDVRARSTPARSPFDGEFDAAISLCQGAFGLAGGARRPPTSTPTVPCSTAWPGRCGPAGGSRVSAFSAYFQVRYLEEQRHVRRRHRRQPRAHRRCKDEAGAEAEVDLWTTCFTPRELRLLAERGRPRRRRTSGRSTPGAYAPTRARPRAPRVPASSADRREPCRAGRSCASLVGRRRPVRAPAQPRPTSTLSAEGRFPCPTRPPTHRRPAEPTAAAPPIGTFDEDGDVHPPPGRRRRPRRHVARRRQRRARWSRSRTARSSRAPSSRSTGTRSCSTSATSPRA